jgi:predicted flap endonuclease-1-like 5' DNA nuclease
MIDDALPKIGAPATRALASIGVTRLSQLARYRTEDLLALHGFGPRAIKLLQDAMNDQGLSFRNEPPAQ